MRALKAGLAVFVLAASLIAATGGSAEIDWAQSPGEGWTQSGAGWVSGSVEHVDTIAVEAGGAVDATLHDGLLYLTSWRSFSIYDVADPLAPQRLSTTPLGVALYSEQPQTDGELLLVSRDAQYLPPSEEAPRGGGVLDIWDVRDPEAPTLWSTYESELGAPFATHRDHLWTCVHECDYAYGAGGTILDLRDPANPTKLGMWTDVAPIRALHHISEVAPGVVLTGSDPMHLLDARETPASPTLLATVEPDLWETPTAYAGTPSTIQNPTALPGRVDWPQALNGRIAIATIETPFTGECDELSGDVQTFVTTGWRDTGTFAPADSYRIATNGTYSDGAPPYNVLGCSAYGLDVHGTFGSAGGPIAVAFFEHGVRILDIGPNGEITEDGGFLPFAGDSTRPLWLSDDVLYSIDLNRGIDILRVGQTD